MNVLRQYDESEVAGAWARTAARLAPDGLLVDGTCDELGRICSWVDVAAAGPRAVHDLAAARRARLPRRRRRAPPEGAHPPQRAGRARSTTLLAALDTAWVRAAPLSVYGPVQRFVAAVEALRDQGVPVQAGRTRWKLGELTVPWGVVAPA